MSRQNPKVLLVYPPNQLMDIEVPRPDGSLGPLYLAGALRAADIEVEILDASVGGPRSDLRDTFHNRVQQPNGLTRIGMTVRHLTEYLTAGAYDIVGIHSNFTPQTRMAQEVARVVKTVNPETFVIAGGVNARAMAPRMLKNGDIDAISITEGEKTVVKLVRAWQKESGLRSVAGIAYLENQQMITNPVEINTTASILDTLPLPAWDLLPFPKYDELDDSRGDAGPENKRRYAPMMTSRGCPFECLYCHISEEKNAASTSGDIGSLRLKSVDRVMREVDILRSLGVTHLYLEDDSLLAKKTRVTDVFKRMAGMGMKISGINGVNLVHFGEPTANKKLKPDRKYLEIIVASGFDEITFPVESASQRILDKYATGKLNHQKLDVVELVCAAVSVGITCPINMMIGFPDETETEMLQSVELGKQLIDAGAPYVTFFIPIPFPGSKLFGLAIKGGHLTPDFDTDVMNWKNPVMKKTEVPPERIAELRDWAWDLVNTESYKKTRIKKEMRSRAV